MINISLDTSNAMPKQGLTTASTLNDKVQCHILVISKPTIGKMSRFTIGWEIICENTPDMCISHSNGKQNRKRIMKATKYFDNLYINLINNSGMFTTSYYERY